MQGTHDPAQREPAPPQGVSRRAFVQGGGAVVGALAFLLPGGCCDCERTRSADKAPPEKRALTGDKARTASAAEKAHATKRGAHADPKRATCVAIADNGMALTSDDFGRLIAWNINGANPAPTPFAGIHTGKVAYVATAGNRVLTAGYDGNVIIHDLANPQQFKTFNGHRQDGTNREVWVAILTPDGKRALSAANDGQILLWDPENPENMDSVVSFNLPAKVAKAPVAGLAFLPPLANEPTQFLSTYGYGDIHRWNISVGNTVVAGPPVQTFSHHNSFPVNAVAVTKDGTRFVSGSFDRTVRVWDLNNAAQELHKFPKLHSQRIWRVALSPDFPIAATASDDGDIRFWNINNGRAVEKPVLKAGSKGSMGVAFTPDSRLVYTLDGTDPDRLINIEANTPKA